VTRILWLEGLEQKNANARSRGIYIHGTVEEEKLGTPVSYGCIRMRSRDVIDLFENLPLGTMVTIQQEKLPHYKRWSAPPPMILVSRSQTKGVEKVAPEKASEAAKPIESEKQEKSEKTEKPEVKLVAAKVPEKTSTKTQARAESAAKSGAGTTDSEEPRVTMGGAAALAALKGSILFSGIPGHGPKAEGLTSSASAKTTADVPAESAPAEELPRVTFRASLGERLAR
jgi:hypothetical protein